MKSMRQPSAAMLWLSNGKCHRKRVHEISENLLMFPQGVLGRNL